MPIGASKVGVLGAGLVPGGSVTFNASGTWDVPPGVKVVSITGVGGAGNAGGTGNSGNAGTGGAGGRGGNPGPVPCVVPSTSITTSAGGFGFNCNKTTGSSGNAGNVGACGNTGASSSALGQNFLGGAGGTGGAAGNAGSGGNVGGVGNARNNLITNPPLQSFAGGGGGNGGGAGAAGLSQRPPAQNNGANSGSGGGGAGETNDGTSGTPSENSPPALPIGPPSPGICPYVKKASAIGIGGNPGGGSGGRGRSAFYPSLGNTYGPTVGPTWPSAFFNPTLCQPVSCLISNACGNAGAVPVAAPLGGFCALNGANFPFAGTPSPLYPNQMGIIRGRNATATRAGGGGGGGASAPTAPWFAAGGGGGGGRGNVGNAGAAGNPGVAANPSTVNCVPVTPGTPTPITVGSPGGQIVISWNPQ